MRLSPSLSIPLVLGALLVPACMEVEATPPAQTTVEDGDEPPRDIYVVVPKPDEPSDAEGLMAAAAPPPHRTFFLNGKGGTYTRGQNNSSTNTSSIVSKTTTIGAFKGTEAQWSQVVACVAEQFKDYDVTVTGSDPGATPHLEVVVGGHPSDLGYSGNVGGVAPLYGDCSVVERAIGFVFSDIYGNNMRSLCETIAHELGHSVGLDHEYLCEDPMTYLYGCGQKVFQNVDAKCGEYEARDCRCGPTQNSVKVLSANLGLSGSTPPPPEPQPGDTAAPTVAVVSPADGAQLPANSKVSLTAQATDDVGVSKLELIWTYSSAVVIDCAAPPQGVTCNRAGDQYTFSFNVGAGARSFSFRATDAAGNVATTPTRTLQFGSTAPEPPPSSAPTVAITSPAANQTVTPGQVIEIRAVIEDDGSIEQARLTWAYPGGESYFYLSQLDAQTWGINLRLGSNAAPGTRTVRVTATDDAGNQTTSSDRPIQVVK